MQHIQTQAMKQKGFTLVELAIVLVIIGLIVGGVLVGQDMIKAAEVRATVSQYEKYNSALNTFRGKFNGLPGDVLNAANFGLESRNGADGRGDGDGLLEGCAGTTDVERRAQGCENILFWRDLSESNMIDSSLTTATDSAAPLAIAGATAIAATFPPAKIGKGNYFLTFSQAGLNYYQISAVNSVVVTTGATTLTVAMTPNEVFQIDSKVDDGRPNTGLARVRFGAGALDVAPVAADWNGASQPNLCIFGSTAHNLADVNYNTNTANGAATTPLCHIRLRFN